MHCSITDIVGTLAEKNVEWRNVTTLQRLIDNAHRDHEIRIQNSDKGYVTGKLYKFLNLATKLMSKSTSRHSISSKSVSCANPSSLQWFASKCPITKSSSGAMLQRGQGRFTLPMVAQYPTQQLEPPGMRDPIV